MKSFTATITRLSHDGRGIGHLDGKTTFVSNALPNEVVLAEYTKRHRQFDEAKAVEIQVAAPERVQPQCAHFSICGGCSQQHILPSMQIAQKQKTLLEHFQHFAKTEPEQILPPMTGPVWGYRYKARLGVKYVEKKGKLLVGFREKQARYLAEIDQCQVLVPSVGLLLPELKQVLRQLTIYQHIPQLEVAVGDEEKAIIVRHMQAFAETDLQLLSEFGQRHGLQIYLQPSGPDSVWRLWPSEGPLRLSYQLPSFALTYQFHPLDFTQVNPAINRQLVPRAVELLELTRDDYVLDLFCGLGNFTLPIALHAKRVVGVEGTQTMVDRAYENAHLNQIDNAEFVAADLSANWQNQAWAQRQYDKILIDPPRTGALDIVQNIDRFQAKRIVYVSCNPATLARDSQVLIHQHGYRLLQAGVIDMFPHTAHVESIAVFQK